ncbi:MAG: putative Hydrolase, alpha/beta fold family protein [Modestobacter sp.]|jgi:pimeloyl-ACP methyl ester carboxylesterase|nr:putative Hydrolase, alpha/beta fold family protein [Modestobacter sp.]MCW2508032.1 putative Hydrolase, alpha/beta fold family protein [Modestobacter sp.]MCW2577991.1 putative Hydrolase, alpha/beta fold family protein [Modestobacter sp.]MCW2619520.1 putative Hydrolase, alpha/beta fold family protein [Modestobacter sp.]
MTTFALMHGGQHGGWCWELLTPELEAAGFGVVAPDMPIDDPAAGAAEWAGAVAAALDGVSDDVVAVAHSMGGLALPVLASLRPVRHMVFLGAMVPVPGQAFLEYLGTAEGQTAISMPMDDSEPDELGRGAFSWNRSRTYFYPDVPEPLARRAWERLRANALTVFTETCPIDTWPDVPATSVVMTEDAAVPPAWARAVSAGRLGSELVEFPGGHSPFLSRPQELAQVLIGIAERAPAATR